MGTGSTKPPNTKGPLLPDAKPTAPRWIPLGLHRYYMEDDLMVLENSGGEFAMADIQVLIKLLVPIHDRYGYYLLLADTSRGVTITPQVRRWVVDWASRYRPHAIMAVIGAGIMTRAAVTLGVHALRLLGKDIYPTEFFTDMEAGRNWLLSQRATAQLRKLR